MPRSFCAPASCRRSSTNAATTVRRLQRTRMPGNVTGHDRECSRKLSCICVAHVVGDCLVLLLTHGLYFVRLVGDSAVVACSAWSMLIIMQKSIRCRQALATKCTCGRQSRLRRPGRARVGRAMRRVAAAAVLYKRQYVTF